MEAASKEFEVMRLFSGEKSPGFNVLTATAVELSRLLQEKKVTSVELVETFLSQIEGHNENGLALHAITNTVPKDTIMAIAAKLDKERSENAVRSPLHGIPFIAKDSMWTDPSFAIPTTGGTYALERAVARKNADIVQKLLDAGMILLGKANLSEMAGMRGSGGFAGWSTIGGQTQSPYVEGGVDPSDTWLGFSTPGGSSSGSAVAVAAGMAPVSLGTETDGSILVPSDRASLYSLKLTVGKFSTTGTLPYTHVTDSLGPMAKSPEDLAAILDLLTPLEDKTNQQFLTKSFKGMRIGFLDPITWASGAGAVRPNEDYTKQTSLDIAAAIDKIEAAGAVVKRNIALRRFSPDDDRMFNSVASRDYVKEFETFVAGLDNTPIRSPDQSILEGALKANVSDEEYQEYVQALQHHSRALGIDKALEENDVDVIMGTPTGRIATIAALAGYPVGTVPLGYANFNGRAFGLSIVAPANAESLILQVMSAWEATFPARKPPNKLHNSEPAAKHHQGSPRGQSPDAAEEVGGSEAAHAAGQLKL
ncbi:hypothetical protein PG991_000976 [Apiospora marii]|uniref:Amidase domain-containing protein n=1 Tax=Apiospora marii TaxID=335849 RepID=A0ABR1STH8_9PEZI